MTDKEIASLLKSFQDALSGELSGTKIPDLSEKGQEFLISLSKGVSQQAKEILGIYQSSVTESGQSTREDERENKRENGSSLAAPENL